MIKSDSITTIAGALLKAQSSMGDATKGSNNPFYKSSFADLNSIREAVTPTLNANGITVLQPIRIGTDGSSYIETTLLHSSGEYLTSQFPIIASKANDPQAFGSAVSYARRYSLQSFLSVGAVDDDAESGMGRGKTNYPNKSEAPKLMENKIDSGSLTLKSGVTTGEVSLTTSPPKKVTFSKKAVTTAVDTGDDI